MRRTGQGSGRTVGIQGVWLGAVILMALNAKPYTAEGCKGLWYNGWPEAVSKCGQGLLAAVFLFLRYGVYDIWSIRSND